MSSRKGRNNLLPWYGKRICVASKSNEGAGNPKTNTFDICRKAKEGGTHPVP